MYNVRYSMSWQYIYVEYVDQCTFIPMTFKNSFPCKSDAFMSQYLITEICVSRNYKRQL